MQLVVDRCFKLGYYGNSFATEGAWPPRSYDLSKQIQKLLDLYPEVFQDVSYEGNGARYDRTPDKGFTVGEPFERAGTWLYLQPSWFYEDMGLIHEWSIKDVMACVKDIYQDKNQYAENYPDDKETLKEIESGKYDCERFLKRRGAA
tara:strand:+ start:706 stop:1146 length:441 start_codon:yes stop_codon:yes gene_type:complete